MPLAFCDLFIVALRHKLVKRKAHPEVILVFIDIKPVLRVEIHKPDGIMLLRI